MKVLQVSTTIGHFGVDKIVAGIYEAIEKKGGNCVWVYGRKRERSKEYNYESYRIGNDKDIYFHAIKSRLLDASGFSSTKPTQRLCEWIDNNKPDIIHLHSLLGYYINVQVLFEYLEKAKIPVVWTQHDCWAFTGHCIHFESISCEKWETECFKCPGRKTYPTSYFLDKSRSNFSRKKDLFTKLNNMVIVSPSQWLDGLVARSFLQEHRHIVIPNGIDISDFSPLSSSIRDKYKITDNKILVLGVSSIWSELKGIYEFNKLAEILDKRKYQIVLIGHIHKREFKLNSNIIHIPRTYDIEELAEWYSAADVFVNPTKADNFPTVNIEALACGTPIITYQTGGSPEVITNNCGFVVPCGDIDKLVSCVRNIEERKTRYIVDSCLTQAEKFSKQEMSRKYLSLYSALLEG